VRGKREDCSLRRDSGGQSTKKGMKMSDPQHLRQLLFGDLDDEIDATRRVLERVPDGRLGWRPHEKSMTLGEIATHLAMLPSWPSATLVQDGFDVGRSLPRLAALGSRKEILDTFEERTAELRDRLEETADADLLAPWELRDGDQILVRTTRAAAVRTFGLSHMTHHRGQLTVYLRLLDVPVPRIYGPTADES
jgi:uncharacterized damage-inducible protein DinB